MKNLFQTLVFSVAASMLTGASIAQEIDVRVATEQGPHYVGVPVVVQLTVEGLDANPQPTCKMEPASDAVRGSLSGVSPRIFQRVTQVGNQIKRITEVTYTIQFVVTANKSGKHDVGPFEISQSGRSKKVAAIEMEFQEVPTTDEMRIVLQMPSTAYPDQRVPIGIEWWFAGNVDNVNELNIDATSLDGFQFLPDVKPVRGASRLPIRTGKGTISLGAGAQSRTEDGKEFTVVRAERTLVPSRTGTFELPPMSATIELVTEWESRRRPSFGGLGGSLLEEAFGSGRRPAKVEMFRAESEPITFEVKPFPSEGRPESFAGGVGNGFSVDVVADRTVVRVGDPIRLTVKLRGDGNIEGATLPNLSADDGLDPERFRLPQGDVSGELQEDGKSKHFLVSVRVLDENISEIPSIAYSWFDADSEKYQTTRSKPIALRVMPAQLVGADSVVSSSPAPKASNSSEDLEQETAFSNTPAFTLTGADLAIENDPVQLLSYSKGLLGQKSFQVVGYTLGSLCIAIALLDRRRRNSDPAVREALANLKNLRSQIESAKGLPEKDAAKQIAASLQSVLADFPEADRDSFQQLISKCEAIAYRPDDMSGQTIAPDIVDASVELISGLRQEVGAS